MVEAGPHSEMPVSSNRSVVFSLKTVKMLTESSCNAVCKSLVVVHEELQANKNW